MAITVKKFIEDLAQATKDPTMVVVTSTEWLDIVNQTGSELSPEVMFVNTAQIAYSTVDTDTHEIDMSSATTYEGLQDIKNVYLIDANGKRWLYINWVFDKELKMLRLDPKTYAEQDLKPSSSYPTIEIHWLSNIPDTAGDGSINLDKAEFGLFRKVCRKEGIMRILMDNIKLDRYRTLVGRANSYELLAIYRDLTSEIELEKRKLTNSNPVKVF
jgi:hypothetical protein